MKKHHSYSLLGLQALKRAALLAIKDAQIHNCKVPYWKDGKIVFEIPGINSKQNVSSEARSSRDRISRSAASENDILQDTFT
ncbi:MAG: hypothetical protein CSA22_01305 [Deltaproteobacteria bacterium]|nr:MAG: hypothetical protein CSA22_01305 [Deltaproteobacteria bacterium]